MNEKMKMVPWATDEYKDQFVIFMEDRGDDKANAFVWVTPGESEERSVWITTFRCVLEYFSQAASPLYFGGDRPKELLSAALDVLNRIPEMALDRLIDEFSEEAYHREEAEKHGAGYIKYEKECLEFFEKAGKEGNGLSAV